MDWSDGKPLVVPFHDALPAEKWPNNDFIDFP